MIRNLAVVMGFALLFTVQASAQQDPQLTQWFNDPAAFNIGAAGETDLTHVNAWYRNQWMGVNGAPVTTMLNLHTKVDRARHLVFNCTRMKSARKATPWSSWATRTICLH